VLTNSEDVNEQDTPSMTSKIIIIVVVVYVHFSSCCDVRMYIQVSGITSRVVVGLSFGDEEKKKKEKRSFSTPDSITLM